MKKIVQALLFSVLLYTPFAHADDDWGCTVLLCLMNPAGPTAVPACVPPIQKLWRELAKGHDFPSCSGSSNSQAQNSWVGVSNCPPQYIRTQQVNDVPTDYCIFSGVVTTQQNGQVIAKTWWNGNQSVTEFLGSYKAMATDHRFDDDYAAWKIEQDRIKAEQPKYDN